MKQKILAAIAFFALTFTAMAQSADQAVISGDTSGSDDVCWVAPEWRNL